MIFKFIKKLYEPIIIGLILLSSIFLEKQINKIILLNYNFDYSIIINIILIFFTFIISLYIFILQKNTKTAIIYKKVKNFQTNIEGIILCYIAILFFGIYLSISSKNTSNINLIFLIIIFLYSLKFVYSFRKLNKIDIDNLFSYIKENIKIDIKNQETKTIKNNFNILSDLLHESICQDQEIIFSNCLDHYDKLVINIISEYDALILKSEKQFADDVISESVKLITSYLRTDYNKNKNFFLFKSIDSVFKYMINIIKCKKEDLLQNIDKSLYSIIYFASLKNDDETIFFILTEYYRIFNKFEDLETKWFNIILDKYKNFIINSEITAGNKEKYYSFIISIYHEGGSKN